MHPLCVCIIAASSGIQTPQKYFIAPLRCDGNPGWYACHVCLHIGIVLLPSHHSDSNGLLAFCVGMHV